MSTDDFIAQFANAIEADPTTIHATTEFKQLEIWDSLCALSVIAMIDEVYQVTLGGEDLESSKTVADLKSIVESRR